MRRLVVVPTIVAASACSAILGFERGELAALDGGTTDADVRRPDGSGSTTADAGIDAADAGRDAAPIACDPGATNCNGSGTVCHVDGVCRACVAGTGACKTTFECCSGACGRDFRCTVASTGTCLLAGSAPCSDDGVSNPGCCTGHRCNNSNMCISCLVPTLRCTTNFSCCTQRCDAGICE
jgi:hypothetical protein